MVILFDGKNAYINRSTRSGYGRKSLAFNASFHYISLLCFKKGFLSKELHKKTPDFSCYPFWKLRRSTLM